MVRKRRVGTYLEVGSELFHNSLPSDETFDKDICRFQVLKTDVLFDKRLIAGKRRVAGTGACSGIGARGNCVAVQIHGGGGTREISEMVFYLICFLTSPRL
jgi:hypothetical protein